MENERTKHRKGPTASPARKIFVSQWVKKGRQALAGLAPILQKDEKERIKKAAFILL